MTESAPDNRATRFPLVLDLAGTLVFAIEGALAAASAHLDLLGAMVLSFVTALGGGTVARYSDWRDTAKLHPELALCGDRIRRSRIRISL